MDEISTRIYDFNFLLTKMYGKYFYEKNFITLTFIPVKWMFKPNLLHVTVKVFDENIFCHHQSWWSKSCKIINILTLPTQKPLKAFDEKMFLKWNNFFLKIKMEMMKYFFMKKIEFQLLSEDQMDVPFFLKRLQLKTEFQLLSEDQMEMMEIFS